MPKYAVIEKSVGETPLRALERFRSGHAELSNVPLTYAGRLDPMASGKLLLLIGDECKKRDDYDALDKEYEFEVLLGISSDSGDTLGLAQTSPQARRLTPAQLKKAGRSIRGLHVLPYPAYSSKTVNGIPLFEYARAGKLGDIKIPTASMRVYRISYLGVRTLARAELMEKIMHRMLLLEGNDFRNDAICARWHAVLKEGQERYVIARYRATVSSGTYIRSLAPLIASRLGTVGLAYSIHRSVIGRYARILPMVGFWSKTYR
jgi:tRNA pseudouridine(55) synthase